MSNQRQGRPADPAGQVQRLSGDETAKQRLMMVLATLSGEKTIEEASAELGISVSRFFELKQQVLSGALAALTPVPRGRPAAPSPGLTREQELEAKVKDLEEELHCALARTEIALVMPRLLRQPVEKKSSPVRGPARRGARAPLAPPCREDGDDEDPAR